MYCNPNLPIILAADTYAYGVGAIISQMFLSIASRTLTSAEKNCAQLEKEALTLIFGVKSFIITSMGIISSS